MALIGALLDAGREEISNVEMVLKQKKSMAQKNSDLKKRRGAKIWVHLGGSKALSARDRTGKWVSLPPYSGSEGAVGSGLEQICGREGGTQTWGHTIVGDQQRMSRLCRPLDIKQRATSVREFQLHHQTTPSLNSRKAPIEHTLTCWFRILYIMILKPLVVSYQMHRTDSERSSRRT